MDCGNPHETALDGEKVPIAWHLRPGDWAIDMERFGPQLAIMMQGILKLHARNDAHAKRIGRYLVYQYRIRAHQKTWAQPYRIETLLTGAGIEPDPDHARRFRERIESALDTLANTVEMSDGPVCIASWAYAKPIAATGRGARPGNISGAVLLGTFGDYGTGDASGVPSNWLKRSSNDPTGVPGPSAVMRVPVAVPGPYSPIPSPVSGSTSSKV